jgi:hypothetical protein
MSWIDCLGFGASLAVLASFCMTTIVPLRIVALASNILFSLYGVLAHIYPVVFLHMILFPINLLKLYRMRSKSGGPGQHRHDELGSKPGLANTKQQS